MGAKSKSGNIRGVARKGAAKAQRRRGRVVLRDRDSWEQAVRTPEEIDDEIDCQRIVQGESGRSLPVYYDEYN